MRGKPVGVRHAYRHCTVAREQHAVLRSSKDVAEVWEADGMRVKFGYWPDRKILVLDS